jgi:hypothetical protein
MAAASWRAKIVPTTCIVLKAAQQYCGGLVTGECHSAKLINFALLSTETEPVMAGKRPLCIYDGVIKELALTDTLDGAASTSVGIFEVDVDGGVMPITALGSDDEYEYDTNGDIQPKV